MDDDETMTIDNQHWFHNSAAVVTQFLRRLRCRVHNSNLVPMSAFLLQSGGG